MRLRTVLLSTIVLAASMAHGQQSFNQSLAQMKIEQNLGKQVPVDVPFLNEEGKRVKFGEIFGRRPVVVLPIFFQCQGICGKETDNLLKTVAKIRDKQVGKDYDVVFLSINPRETPELAKNKRTSLLKIFEGKLDTNGMHFLVGAPSNERSDTPTGAEKMEIEREKLANIRRVTDALGFGFAYDETDGRINHPAGLMFLTPAGRISGYIVSSEFQKPVVEEGIALAEADKIGRKADVELLGCIMIDPVTGQRSIVIENVIRLIAGIFALGIFGWIGVLSVKNRRHPILPGSDNSIGGSPTSA